jgi:hypothetical protein
MKSFIYLPVFALIFTLSIFSIQDAHAFTATVSDEGSCESAIPFAVWSNSTDTCTITTSQTILLGETLTVNPGITLVLDPGIAITNDGTIINYGQITINTLGNSGAITNNNGTINNYSSIDNFGNIDNNLGGTIFNNSTGTITNNSGGTGIYNVGIITNNGIIDNSSGTIVNAGTLTIDGDLINNPSLGFYNNSGGNMIVTENGSIANYSLIDNNGSIDTSGTITNNIGGIIHNDFGGTITNNSGGIILNEGDITNDSGAIIDNFGDIDNTDTIVNNGTISNYGTINNSEGLIDNPGTIDNYCGAEYIGFEPATGNLVNYISPCPDPLAPVITLVTPASNSTVNGDFAVNYTLDQLVSEGGIIFERTGGSADVSSPHIYNSAPGDKTSGAHSILRSVLEAGFGNSLVSGAIYNMTVYAANGETHVGTPVVNSAITYVSDTITINPIPANPKWGIPFEITGTVTGTGDNVEIDWGDTTQSAATLILGNFNATHTYDSASIGTNTITAYFKDEATTVATSTPTDVDVQKHSTSISLNLPTSVVETSSVSASGKLIDTDTGKGIPLLPITLSDAPANILSDTTTNGVSFTSSTTPMQLVFCGTCTPNPGSVLAGANILHVFTDTVITFPPSSAQVTFLIDDMGTNPFTATVTPTGGNPFDVSSGGVAPDMLLLQVELIGGGTITITSSNSTTGVGISSIRMDDPAADPRNWFDENFDSFAISECDTCSSLLLGGGNYLSTGTTTSGTSVSEPVTATFAEDANYLGSSTPGSYAKESDSLAGVGGTTVFTATPSSGTIYSAIVCAGGNDSDGDNLCTTWEGGTNGVPYTATFGGTTYNYKYVLPGSSPTVKNVYVEFDSMAGHNLLAAAKSSLGTAFSAKSITFTLDDTTDGTISHLDNINAWFDTDANRNNDFDSLKAQYFGASTERPTITNAGTYSLVSGTPVKLRAAGIAITTPSGEYAQGTIIIKERITVSNTATMTFSTPAIGAVSGVEFGTASSTTTATGTSRVVVTKIPFATTATKSFTLPTIDTSVTPSTGTVALVSGSGQMAVITTKLDAKAQAYHYGLGVHAIGSAGCNSPSGLAEPLGNDFIIALGCAPFGESNGGHTGVEGTAEEQSGTILHELGHNFNLAHGGPGKILVSSSTSGAVGTVPADKDQNCKPNHSSVMNYARQVPMPLGYLTVANWNLSYSSGLFQGSPLTEAALNESLGVRSSSATTPQIVWAAIATGSTGTPVIIKTASSTTAAAVTATAINWDNDGNLSETSAASTDINNFGIIGCAMTTGGPVLEDYDEWNNLQFNFRTATGAQSMDGTHAPAHKTAELTAPIAANVTQSLYDSGLLWKMSGFYHPVDMNGMINTIKGGQSVPLKFEVFDGIPAGTTERTSVLDISKFTQAKLPTCSNFAATPSDAVEITNTGGTSLKYDTTAGQFQANWKTPKLPNTCWVVKVNATNNGESLTAYFKLK